MIPSLHNDNFKLFLFKCIMDKFLLEKSDSDIENSIKNFISSDEYFKNYLDILSNNSYEELIKNCTFLNNYKRKKLLILYNDIFSSLKKYFLFFFYQEENKKYSTLVFINQNDFIDKKIDFERELISLIKNHIKEHTDINFVYENILQYEIFFNEEINKKSKIFFYISENNFVENMNNKLFLEFLGKIKVKNLIFLNLFDQILNEKKYIPYDIKHMFKENIKMLNEININLILLYDIKMIENFSYLSDLNKYNLNMFDDMLIFSSDVMKTKEYSFFCLLKELTCKNNKLKDSLFFLKYFFDTETIKIILRELEIFNSKNFFFNKKDILNFMSISNIIFDIYN